MLDLQWRGPWCSELCRNYLAPKACQSLLNQPQKGVEEGQSSLQSMMEHSCHASCLATRIPNASLTNQQIRTNRCCHRTRTT